MMWIISRWRVLTQLHCLVKLDQVCANLRWGDEDVAGVYGVINRDKRATTAGASNTFARFNHKECAVISALDHTAATIKKLVFHPFECNADMRAAILVEINVALLFDRKELASSDIKTLAARLGDISRGAKAMFFG